MIARLAAFMFLLCMILSAHGQPRSRDLYAVQASDLLANLKQKISDSERVDVLLNLAEHYFLNRSEDKANVDSAAYLIKEATRLNAGIISGRNDGYVVLVQSYLADKMGDSANGKRLLNKALRLLEASGDEYHLILAYLALADHDDSNFPLHPVENNRLMMRISVHLKKIKNDPGQIKNCLFGIESFYESKTNTWDFSMKLSFLSPLIQISKDLNDKKSLLSD
jgi:hypothetical protein